jgi:hypothetical protein
MTELAPILLKPDDVINIKRGAHAIGKSERTVRRWFKEYRIGRQSTPTSPVDLSFPALHMVASGDWLALEQLRAGERDHPAVRRYFDHLGIPI